MKTVVHISENTDEAANRAFTNLKNLAGTRGIESAVLVANGPGVKVLLEGSPYGERVREALASDVVSLRACANTMATMGHTADDLVPGVDVATNGGVVELTRLQEQGYAYVKVP